MGKVRFLAFYLLAGSRRPRSRRSSRSPRARDMDAAVPNLGASGAVSGVLGAYLVLLPNASVLTLVFYFLVEVPAFLFLGFWFLFQLWEGGFSLVQPEAGGGVAFFAHMGGFVFGAADRSPVLDAPTLAAGLLMDAEEFEEHVRAALDMLPEEIAAGPRERRRRGRGREPAGSRRSSAASSDIRTASDASGRAAGEGRRLPAAARGGVSRPGRARAPDPDHGPPRACALLRDRRGPDRRARRIGS